MLTAYDYSSAQGCDAAGADILLVGDSLAMVVLGHDTTASVTLDEMLPFARAVTRAAPRPFVVGDLPFGSYLSDDAAVESAARYVKEAGVDAVKLEGGRGAASAACAAIADRAKVPVLGHVGLTPQYVGALGGYRVQGRTAAAAAGVLDDAIALAEAGACAVVLEMVPDRVAAAVTEALRPLGVPTIGIGAGAGTRRVFSRFALSRCGCSFVRLFLPDHFSRRPVCVPFCPNRPTIPSYQRKVRVAMCASL